MAQAKKDVLATLKAELAFVESGGYRAPLQAAWRPQFIFQDSPTCLNYRNLEKRLPCKQCALMEFVPNGFQQERFPCRYIPLDESGQTLDSLYRTGTEEETHEIVTKWLRNTIARLERENDSSLAGEESKEPLVLTITH